MTLCVNSLDGDGVPTATSSERSENKLVLMPFNSPRETRAAKFIRRPPEVLWMSIALICSTGHEAEAHRQRLLLEHRLLQNIRLFQPNDQVRAPIFATFEMPSYLVKRLTPGQRKWIVNGVYLQAGYYDTPGVRGIHTSIAVGMTLYDHGVLVTGSEDPAGHPLFNWPAEDIAAAERAMENHYCSGLAWLCRGLLPHRTEVLTKSHAILEGRVRYARISAPCDAVENNSDSIQE